MKTIAHRFVDFIPENLETGILYISLEYKTAVHSCACGCGNRVVTPLSPTDWKLTFDGVSISLYPSIGNSNFSCRSHYWIKNNKIKHALNWNEEEIIWGRQQDEKNKKIYFRKKKFLRFLSLNF